MKYKGYEIWTSTGGGKAGRGFNKTATVQVREWLQPPNYLLKKQIRFKVDDPESLVRAVKKAQAFIDDLVIKEGESKAAS
jgi:hypothetical protein